MYSSLSHAGWEGGGGSLWLTACYLGGIKGEFLITFSNAGASSPYESLLQLCLQHSEEVNTFSISRSLHLFIFNLSPPPGQLITTPPKNLPLPPHLSPPSLQKELITILGISGQRYSQWTARSNYLPDCYWELWLGAVTMSNRQQVEANESRNKGLWSCWEWGRCPLSLSACFSLSTCKWIKYRTQKRQPLPASLRCVFSYSPVKKMKRLSLASALCLSLFSTIFHTSRFVSSFSVP